jgi:hypothetical protein
MHDPNELAELNERRAALYEDIRETCEPLPWDLIPYRVVLLLGHKGAGEVPPVSFVQLALNDARNALADYQGSAG